MKSTVQDKTVEKKDVVTKTNFQINSFSDLIKLAETNKEMELKYDLERNVKLVKFETGKIDINFNENLNKNFIKKLSQNLFDWTGKRWIISLSKEDKSKTFHQKKIEDKEKIIKEEKSTKIFKEMTQFFPDAELLEVKKDNE